MAKYYNVHGEFVFNEKKKTMNLNEERMVANLYTQYIITKHIFLCYYIIHSFSNILG